MSNIQLFEQAFAIDFPVEVADMVLQRMSDLYGSAFTKNFEVYADEELRQLACTVLNGLTPTDIARGLARMNSEEWCPKNLPTFRSWCEQGGDVMSLFREIMADGRITQGEVQDMSKVIHQMHVALAELDKQIQACIDNPETEKA